MVGPRDYFAGLAMQELLKWQQRPLESYNLRNVATLSYAMADAMLVVRNDFHDNTSKCEID